MICHLVLTLLSQEQSEPKETGHTPEITTPGHEKDKEKEAPPCKKPEVKRPHLRKSRSQDLPDKTAPAQGKVLSETRTYTQEAYSSTSRVETVMVKSTVERKEKHHSTVTHKHTFNVSSSPVDRDRKIHILSQSRSSSQETPPPSAPTAPSFSDIQREFHVPKKARAQRPPQESGHSGSQVCQCVNVRQSILCMYSRYNMWHCLGLESNNPEPFQTEACCTN